jgi:hypothetical protein
MRDRFPPTDEIWPPSEPVQRFLIWGAAGALIGECLLYALVPMATGYETSLITPYPLVHWFMYAIVIAAGVTVFVGDAAQETGYWRYTLVLVLCNYGLFAFLPAIRGYALYGRGTTDALYHLGYIKGITELGGLPVISGEIPWYPLLYSVGAQLQILGVPLSAVKYLISFMTIVLLVVGSGAALYALLGDRAAFLLGMAAGTPIVFATKQIGFQPQFVSITLFPVIVACLEGYRRTDSANYLPILLVLLGSIIYFHPVTFLYLVVLLVVSIIFWRMFQRWTHTPRPQLRHWLAAALVPLSFIWFVDHETTASKLAVVAQSVGGTPPSPAGTEVAQAADASLSILQLAVRFVQLYGATMIYIAVAGLVGLVVCKRVINRRATGSEAYLTAHAGVGFLITVPLLIFNPVQGGILRITRYLLVFAILLVGVGLLWAHRSGRESAVVGSLGLVVAIVVAALLGSGAAYVPNSHLTYAEYDGTQFVLRHHDGETPLRAYDTSSKMEMYVDGGHSQALRPYRIEDGPDHGVYPGLGYGYNDTAAETFGRAYLTTKVHDRRQHTATYYFPEQRRAQFFYDGYHMGLLQNDTTANKYYDNGGFEAWQVRNTTAGDR